MQQTWLITGAAGFIGSNVASHLLSQGHTVIGLDNLSSGFMKNIDPFQALPNWHWSMGDINGDHLPEIFKQFDITHVLHLAAIVSIQACEEHPENARLVNEQGFERVLDFALEHGVKTFIYASSSAVYGATGDEPIVETTPLKPISLYGETKVNNERVAAKKCTDKPISCVGMRFFNLFGPNQAMSGGYAAVIPKWVHAIQENQTPIIYGDGTATRDFCPIENVIQAIGCVTEAEPKGHHAFNIGNGHAVTLKSLYALICDIMNKHPEPNLLPWRPDDIVHSCASIALAESVLGYRPKVTLEAGLETLLNS